MGSTSSSIHPMADEKNISHDDIYEHKPNNTPITCQHMGGTKTNPMKCPIYKAMKQNYDFTESNLKHLHNYTHFKDGYNSKTECRYGQKCKAFVRLSEGGNRLDDRCHIKLYRHPPRSNRQIKLSQNTNKLIINDSPYQKLASLHRPTTEDKKIYKINRQIGALNALIAEVIKNGFKYDLCLSCGKNDECKHDVYNANNPNTLLSIVDQKLNCQRHKQVGKCDRLNKGEMLALLLYTGCDCNYDLCGTQRKGDYDKWKWFDYCLWRAIWWLNIQEKASYKLYSGLNKVKLDKKTVKHGGFVTYVSSSWNESVAKDFMGNDGMLIEFDEECREFDFFMCCDVSWISKFEDECEVLFARALGNCHQTSMPFSLSVVDEQGKFQIVSLKNVGVKWDDHSYLIMDHE